MQHTELDLNVIHYTEHSYKLNILSQINTY